MKHLLLALFLLLASPFSVTSQTPTVLERSFSSIVQVTVPSDEPDEFRFCTGVRVGIIRILTAEHCIPKDNDNVFINNLPARVVKKNTWLALLESQPVPGEILKVAPDNPKIGTEITSTGYVDLAQTRLSLHGRIAGIRDNLLFIDRGLIPGMSGGPVIDEAGQLVGINQASDSITGLVSSTKEIRAFLK